MLFPTVYANVTGISVAGWKLITGPAVRINASSDVRKISESGATPAISEIQLGGLQCIWGLTAL